MQMVVDGGGQIHPSALYLHKKYPLPIIQKAE